MRDKPAIDLGLTTTLDELFMDEKGRAEFRLPKIHDVLLSEIDDFPDHPFYVRNDEDGSIGGEHQEQGHHYSGHAAQERRRQI